MNPYLNAYRRVTADADTPAKRLNEVFERCILECRRAKDLIEKKDAAGKGSAINRAVDLVSELLAALDRDLAPELCERLSGLYLFVLTRLGDANIKFTVEPVDDAIRILESLKDAFWEAAKSQ